MADARPIHSIASAARNVLLLERELTRASSFPDDRRAHVRTLLEAAMRLAVVADQLTDETGTVAALVLYREALPLLVSAVTIYCDPAHHPKADGAGSPWEILNDLAGRGLIPPLPAHVEASRAILTSSAPSLVFDQGEDAERLAKQRTVQSTIRFLRRLVEPRSVKELKAARITRVVVTILGLVLVVGWGISRTGRRPNLALHRPVTVSARFAQSSAPLDNGGVVNGEIEATYGVHTALGSGWVMVDLGEPHKLGQVKIYNRADAFFDDGLPLSLELSDDGLKFALAERRTTGFTCITPWIFDVPRSTAPARFVRVRSDNFVALTEIEIYERP